MLTDLLLASAHHLLAFAIVAMLATQAALLRGPIDHTVIRRLSGVDLGYGLSAMSLIVIGVLRIFQGVKGYDFYQHNPWFHAKISAFLLVGVLSIWPTLAFGRWRKALRQDSGFLPEPHQVTRLSRIVRFELILIAAVLVFAAMMARFGGF
ncbi:DUF2214 family protein [Lysobacter fragariae]